MAGNVFMPTPADFALGASHMAVFPVHHKVTGFKTGLLLRLPLGIGHRRTT
jgi:hypothetical protein